MLPSWIVTAALAAAPDASELALATVRARAPEADFVVERAVPWAGGTHVHLRQRIGGLAVAGPSWRVSLDPRGQVRRIRGPEPIGAIDTHPTVSDIEAKLLASGWASGLLRSDLAWEPRTSLAIYRSHDGAAALAWSVKLALAEPFLGLEVWVDARSGEILGHRRTSFDARGNVYPSNPVASALTEVELPGLTDPETLSGEYAYAWSCDDFSASGVCREKSSHALPDGAGDYLFDPDATSSVDPLAEVQMYYHLDQVNRWFEDRVGFRLAEPIEGLVNFPLENAFYGDADGDGVEEVAFGQGAGIDFAYDADVIYHEFGHAVIGNVTSLGLFGADIYGVDFTPLSLNEGSADVFSVLITGDPELGEYAGSGFGLPSIRDLDPDRRCPDNLYGEGHEDGMIWGAIAWNLASDPLVGPEVTTLLYYGAATSWSGSAVGWSEAGQSLLDTLDDLEDAGVIDSATHGAAQAHVEAGGLVGCERVIPLDDGITSTQFFLAAGLVDAVGGYLPLSTQFSLDVPDDATAAVFEITSVLNTLPGDLPWTVFVRKGGIVEHEVQSAFGFDIPVPTVYDFAVDGTGPGEVIVDAGSEEPLVPGETYTFALSTRSEGLGPLDLGVGELEIAGHVERADATSPETTTPGGTPDEVDPIDQPSETGEEKGGCGCATDAAPVGWLAFALALFGVRRRR